MWLCVYGAWKEPEGSMIFLRHIWETFHDILTFSWQTQWHFIVFSVMKTYFFDIFSQVFPMVFPLVFPLLFP